MLTIFLYCLAIRYKHMRCLIVRNAHDICGNVMRGEHFEEVVAVSLILPTYTSRSDIL